MTQSSKKSTTEKKYALLNEGIIAFLKQGYHAVGLKQLLDSCSVPKGSFYHYFDSKDDYLAQVIDYYIKNMFALYDNVDQQTDLSAFAKIKRITEVKQQMMQGMQMKGCLWGVMVGETLDSVAPARDAMTRAFDKWLPRMTALFAAAQDAHEVTNIMSATELAHLYWSQWQGGLLLKKLQSKPDQYIADFDNFFALIGTENTPNHAASAAQPQTKQE